MKFVPTGISRFANSAIFSGRKHSPAILFGVGMVGFVGTTILACKATLKVEQIIETAEKDLSDVQIGLDMKRSDYTDDEAKHDKIVIYTRTTVALAKLYAPAIGVGILSVAALTQSHRILNNRNAAITAAYAAVIQAFDEYRGRARELLGEEKERELRYPLEKCEIEETDEKGKLVKKTKEVRAPGSASMYARFFDRSCSSWEPIPSHNIVFLQCQQNWANDRLKAKGHLFLNEVYDMLGIERSPAGQVVGWLWKGDGDNYVSFGIFDKEVSEEQWEFITGREDAILLDFNVDGMIYQKI